MTQAEVKVFETEVVLFPVKNEAENVDVKTENEVVEKKIVTLKNDVRNRFGRLRKNLRKRSVSIF